MKKQLQFVRTHLDKYGKISRNMCLANFISRLGAIMFKLKEQGYDVEGKYEKGDFIYYMKNQVPKVSTYILRTPSGEVVETREIVTYQ